MFEVVLPWKMTGGKLNGRFDTYLTLHHVKKTLYKGHK